MNLHRLKKLKSVFGISFLMILLYAGTSAFAAGGIDKDAVGKCKECHEKHVISFDSGNPHAKVWEHRSDGKTYSCENCHGPGEKHSKDKDPASIINFGKLAKTPAETQNQQCLACHKGSEKLSFWELGKHKKNDVSCTACHSMHKGPEAVKPPTDTCVTCHKDVRSQVNKRSHHPIVEGKVSCSDCHNPHGSLNNKMLAAESTNQLCYKCHADKRGPFMWEHPPVAEDCSICHTPHGSAHNKLLVEDSPFLCKECHNQDGHGGGGYDNHFGFNGTRKVQFLAGGCVKCHSRIHGSNAPGVAGTTFNSGTFFLR